MAGFHKLCIFIGKNLDFVAECLIVNGELPVDPRKLLQIHKHGLLHFLRIVHFELQALLLPQLYVVLDAQCLVQLGQFIVAVSQPLRTQLFFVEESC